MKNATKTVREARWQALELLESLATVFDACPPWLERATDALWRLSFDVQDQPDAVAQFVHGFMAILAVVEGDITGTPQQTAQAA